MYLQNKRAFTLMELLCVLFLIAILMSIAFPSLNQTMTHHKLQTDAATMAHVLRDARTQAISSGEPRVVEFLVQGASYRVIDSSSTYKYKLSSGIQYAGNTTFSKSQSGIPTCTFYPSGSCNGGTVTLKGGNQKRYVIVIPVMGRVRVSSDNSSQ